MACYLDRHSAPIRLQEIKDTSKALLKFTRGHEERERRREKRTYYMSTYPAHESTAKIMQKLGAKPWPEAGKKAGGWW